MSGAGGNEIERLLARAAGGARVSRAAMERALVDLRTPDAYRLSERQRSLTRNIVDRLLTSITDQLRCSATEDSEGPEPGLGPSRPWGETAVPRRHRRLLRAALDRADEHLVMLLIRGEDAPFPADAGSIVTLLGEYGDATLSQFAADYVVSESRRYDCFGEPMLPFGELAGRTAAAACWLAAAWLRQTQIEAGAIDESALDPVIQAAVRGLLAERDIRSSIDRRAARLVGRLARIGEVDDDFLMEAFRAGQIALFAAALAQRTALPASLVRSFLIRLDMAALIVLMRAAELSEEAVGLILAPLSARDLPQEPPMSAFYTRIDRAAAQRQLHRWRLDPGYARAIAAVEEDGAQ